MHGMVSNALLQAVAELAHYTTSVRILGSFPRHSVRQSITARTLVPLRPHMWPYPSLLANKLCMTDITYIFCLRSVDYL